MIIKEWEVKKRKTANNTRKTSSSKEFIMFIRRYNYFINPIKCHRVFYYIIGLHFQNNCKFYTYRYKLVHLSLNITITLLSIAHRQIFIGQKKNVRRLTFTS